MLRRKFIVVLVLVIIGVTWYLFRPERLFVNQTVNDGFPAANSERQSASPQVLFKGNFHGVAHETKGFATVYQLPNGGRVLALRSSKPLTAPRFRSISSPPTMQTTATPLSRQDSFLSVQ